VQNRKKTGRKSIRQGEFFGGVSTPINTANFPHIPPQPRFFGRFGRKRFHFKEEFPRMKKLTKTLSLVLVIAMVVSLCVVGASAKTFSDYKAPTTGTDYTEAIDVMSGVGIIDGMNGGFNAAGNFTRAQAAKIIAYMQLGVTKAEALSFNTNTAVIFKDVPTTYWAYNYIEYCAQQGIISGFGNGYFKPNDTLTGYQWAKMLLSAVGFGVNKEYNGVNWAINAARDGLKYGVFTARMLTLPPAPPPKSSPATSPPAWPSTP
jgi:hypothetical protein